MRFGYLYNFGITSSPTHHYQYDDVGNRTAVLDLGVTKSYGANSVNAYTSISGFAVPVHDANGNMNSGPLGVVGAATSALTYGKENNNLLSASGAQATNFVYDAMGRLVQFSYTVNSVTKTEILTWAGWTLMTREIFSGNAVSETHRYTWGTDLSGTMEGAGGVGGLLAIERNLAGSNTWDIRYTHADANGNIIALTNSSGAVSARYRYDAFGKVLNATDVDNSGWVNHNIHGFSSKPSFGNQGLLYYGYRWYSPSLGRWINRDPIEESGGMNLYGFVGNDALSWIDVLGLDVWVEGPNKEEPWKHESLCVGDPTGEYQAYSYGATGLGFRPNPKGGAFLPILFDGMQGLPYWDYESGADIDTSRYIFTSPEIDRAIQDAYDDYIYIERSKNRKGEYRLFNANCITWTKHHFNYLKSFLLSKQLGVYTGQGPPKSVPNFDNFE